MRIIFFVSAFLLVAIISCDPAMENRNPDPGTADFARYVALGNSLTAGYANNALYREAQLNSFPNLLAGQMHEAGGGSFAQPLVEPGVGSDAHGNPRLILGVTEDGGLAPVPAADEGQGIFSQSVAGEGPFNNLGVPGAKTFHLLSDDLANLNPFYGRFAASSDHTVLQQALELDPTFFTLWIGNNDVLDWATQGGIGDVGGADSGDMTGTGMFESGYETLLGSLTSGGAQGVAISLPDITAIPFFEVIPWNALELTAEQAKELEDGYDEQIPQIPNRELFIPEFHEGNNGFVIKDPAVSDTTNTWGNDGLEFRKATAEDKILLSIPQDSLQPPPAGPGWGTAVPIPDQYTLRKPQVEQVYERIDEFNEIIEDFAAENDVPLLNSNRLFEQAQAGILFDGAELNTEYVQGGLFSLDGIHLTDRGNAVITNELIELINREYNASLPPLNIGDFQGVRFP